MVKIFLEIAKITAILGVSALFCDTDEKLLHRKQPRGGRSRPRIYRPTGRPKGFGPRSYKGKGIPGGYP